jgi:hypothetical protein
MTVLADQIILPITDLTIGRGWYSDQGFHDPSNNNYIVGKVQDGTIYRNWFTFDNSATPQITDASLVMRLTANYASVVSVPVEYSLWDVTTPMDALRGGTGGTSAFADLGSGLEFGSIALDAFANGNSFPDIWLSIPLNATFVDSFNATHGEFAIGGMLTYPNNTQFVYLWGGSGINDGSWVQLQVTLVPEPSTFSLLFVGAAAFMGFRLLRMANPAHALDGRIPSLLHTGHHRPAPSDEHRSRAQAS